MAGQRERRAVDDLDRLEDAVPDGKPWSLTVTAGAGGSTSSSPFTHARMPDPKSRRRPDTPPGGELVICAMSIKFLSQARRYLGDVQADVAQLVERNLAKVEVASSSLVVRSEKGLHPPLVEWPRGEATDCKSVYAGSNPVSTSISTTREARVHGRLAQR